MANASARSTQPLNPPSARDTGSIVAPKLRISATRSLLIQSGMKIETGCPSARPMAANAIPVLPLVASTIRSPGWILPQAYASFKIDSAIRSLMLPVRF